MPQNKLKEKYPTVTSFLLASLIPYTQSNLELVFQPSRFINHLFDIHENSIPKSTLRGSYYRLIKRGLIEIDDHGVPKLTAKGCKQIKKFEATRLKHAQLFVMFDIPEAEKNKRQHLRLLLKELGFKQIQKSIWSSQFDHREILKAEIKDNDVDDYVKIFEAREIKI